MDITKQQFMIIIEKLKMTNGIIDPAAKEDIKSYLDRQVKDSPEPTEPTTNEEGQTIQPVQQQPDPRMVWMNHSVSYNDVKGWYDMTERHCKPIPNKPTGKGLCPFGGKHYNIETQLMEDNQPFSVPTGSTSKLVCPMHQHELDKRDETRKLFAWVKNNSPIYSRSGAKWTVSEFPQDLQGRVISYLNLSGATPNNVQIYNQQPQQQQQGQAGANPNPLNLTLGTPGVIVCANCSGLARHDAETCPTCMQSPTTGLQKVGSFLGGIGTLGATVATGFVANQTQMYSNQAQAMVPKGCPQCFTQNAGNAVNCTRCGASLTAPPPQQQYPQQQYSQTPKY